MFKKSDKKLNPIAKTLSTTALATAVLAGAATAPSIASAEVSASFAVSNMYLFRGQNLSKTGAHVSGSLDYAHHSGLYAGIWGSSEGTSESSEYDLYFGFAGSYGDFGYDLGFVEYVYPGQTDNALKFNNSELYLLMSYMGFGLDLYFSSGIGDYDSLTSAGRKDESYKNGERDFNDYGYYAVHYTFEDFTFLVGGVTLDEPTLVDGTEYGEYNHIDVTYAATDELSFTLSQIVDRDDIEPDESNGYQENDMLFAVTWAKSFDL